MTELNSIYHGIGPELTRRRHFSSNHYQLWKEPRNYLSNWVGMDLLVLVIWQFFQNHSSNQAWRHQKSVCRLSIRYRKMSNQPNEYKSKFQRNQKRFDLKFPHHCNSLNKILKSIIRVFWWMENLRTIIPGKWELPFRQAWGLSIWRSPLASIDVSQVDPLKWLARVALIKKLLNNFIFFE